MYKVKNEVSETGLGLFSGKAISLTLSPYNMKGIWFKNKNGNVQILSPENILIDNHNTSIVFNDGTTIKLIEHLLSAIYAFGISSILISVNDDEIPLFDGSAASYVTLLKDLILEQEEEIEISFLTKKIEVREGEFYVKVKPNHELIINSKISFPGTPIGKQSFKFKFSKENFLKIISPARTFGIVHDLETARKFYKGANLSNTLIIAQNKLLNKQRVEKEFVKHKILDSIGDLRTFETPLMMTYESFGSSHRLNNKLLKKIIEEKAFKTEKIPKYNLESSFGIIPTKQFAFS